MQKNKKSEKPTVVSLEQLQEQELAETLAEDSYDGFDDWPAEVELDFNKDPDTSYWPDYDDEDS
jgi:hypothetical protein